MPSQLAELYKVVEDSGVIVMPAGATDIVVPFDDSAVDHVSKLDFGTKQAGIRALEVENLLNIVASRINSCLALRERAQEIQIRALSDAVEIHVQERATAMQTSIDEMVSPAANAADNAQLTKQRQALSDLMLLRPALLKSRAKEPGHGSNYGERYDFLRRMFQAVFEDAYVRAKVVTEALKAVYGIDHPLPALKKDGFLDELTFWAQTAADRLEVVLEGRRKVTLALSIGSPDASTDKHVLSNADFIAQRAAGIYNLDLKSSFERLRLKEPRVRSLCVQVIPKDGTHIGKYYAISLTPPPVVLAPGDNTVPMLAMAGEVSSCWDLATTDFHNFDPTAGPWTLKLQSQPVYGPADAVDVLAHIVLHFTVSVVR